MCIRDRDIIQDQNGELVMFTLIGQEAEGKKKAYRYDGSSWSEDTASPVKELLSLIHICRFR